MKELNEFNQKRGEKRLQLKNLMLVHYRLNNRTEFEPDDTFSQKTVTSCVIKQMKYRYHKENAEDHSWYKLTKEINKSEVVEDVEEL